MSRAFDIVINKQQLKEITDLLADVPKGVPRVMTRSINKTGTKARTKVVRRICSEVNLKIRDVRERNVTLTKANYNRLRATIHISGRRIPLKNFSARQTRRGVSYAIRKGKRQTLDDAFLAMMDSGHKGVFLRTGTPRISRKVSERTSKRKGRKRGMAFMVRPRLPIDERYGPSVPMIVDDIQDLSRRVLDEQIASDLHREIYTQVDLVLQRHRGVRHG